MLVIETFDLELHAREAVQALARKERDAERPPRHPEAFRSLSS